MSEAALKILEEFKTSDLPYITATHDVCNPHSGNVMKKIGMKYCYSYREQWMPKNILVTFRMYQYHFKKDEDFIYLKYWNKYPHHIEKDI